ncbi:MAG: DEAD/DEAH box helicase [Marinagarivorans sp.]|nr:DEAD/DEAH box helicase [Marinagarivorans sp.]
MLFENLGLNPAILTAIAEQGYTIPSPIQVAAIPPALEGRDLMAAAQTGTGKTAGFTLPILHRLALGQKAAPNQVRALVLTPTRELAAQVAENVAAYSAHLPLRSNVVFGGVKINPQMMALRRGSDVLVATPGRLWDLYQQGAVKFNQLEVLVLDEADRMLDMGFIHDIRKILAVLPKQRQTLMFSATFSDEIRTLAKTLVNNPVEVSVAPSNSTAKSVEQWIHPVDKAKKSALLIRLIKEGHWQQALIFSRTKHGANKLTKQLEDAGIKAAAIHGNKSQGARTRALAEFKSGDIRILVATDIAARGLDIDQLPQVVNFDLPNVPEDYVHRIGRTGRAGASGFAISLVSADEFDQLKDIERVIGSVIRREYVEGCVPVNDVPPSPTPGAQRAARPKQPRPQGEPRQNRAPNSAVANKPRTRRSSEPGKASSGTPANGKPSGSARSGQRSNSGRPMRDSRD